MTAAPRCRDCDAPLAGVDDLRGDDTPLPGDDLLCWRAIRADVCQREPVDWRARALVAESVVTGLLADVAHLTERRDALLATIARISQETPLTDEVRGALAQRGVLLAEIGTLRAALSEATATADAFNAERVAAGREILRLRADRDTWRLVAETQTDLCAEVLADYRWLGDGPGDP